MDVLVIGPFVCRKSNRPDLTSSSWTLTEEVALRGFSVEWAEPGRLILARRNELYEAAGPDATPRPLGRLDAGPWRPLLARIRPAQRALRFGFYNLLRLPDGTFFYTFDKGVGIWDGRSFAPLPGLVRPTRVLRGAAALDREGEVWFGEYVGQRGSARDPRLPLPPRHLPRRDRVHLPAWRGATRARDLRGSVRARALVRHGRPSTGVPDAQDARRVPSRWRR